MTTECVKRGTDDRQQTTDRPRYGEIYKKAELLKCATRPISPQNKVRLELDSAAYTSQTRYQKSFTISKVAPDWHKLMIPQRTMRPSIATHTNKQCTCKAKRPAILYIRIHLTAR